MAATIHKNATCAHIHTHKLNKQLDEVTRLSLHVVLLDLINTLQLISAFQVFTKGQLVNDA